MDRFRSDLDLKCKVTEGNSSFFGVKKKRSEASLSIIETVFALGLLAAVLLEVVGIQGKSISFSEFLANSNRATWLGKAIFAKLEWGHRFYPISELILTTPLKDQKFDELLCPKGAKGCPFTYGLEVEPWKFPLVSFLSKMLSESADPALAGVAAGMKDQLEGILKQQIGDTPFVVSRVTVGWALGGKREEVSLIMLLTDQRKLDETIMGQKGLEPGWSDNGEAKKSPPPSSDKTNKKPPKKDRKNPSASDSEQTS